MRVEDVVIKTLIAGAPHISAACDVFRTHRRNCFGRLIIVHVCTCMCTDGMQPIHIHVHVHVYSVYYIRVVWV